MRQNKKRLVWLKLNHSRKVVDVQRKQLGRYKRENERLRKEIEGLKIRPELDEQHITRLSADVKRLEAERDAQEFGQKIGLSQGPLTGKFQILAGWSFRARGPAFSAKYNLSLIREELDKAALLNLAVANVLRTKGIKYSPSVVRSFIGHPEVQTELSKLLDERVLATGELAYTRFFYELGLEWLRLKIEPLMTSAFWMLVSASQIAAKKHIYETLGEAYDRADEIEEKLNDFMLNVKAAVGVNLEGGRRRKVRNRKPIGEDHERERLRERREFLILGAMLKLREHDPNDDLTGINITKQLDAERRKFGAKMSRFTLHRWIKDGVDIDILRCVADHLRGRKAEDVDFTDYKMIRERCAL